LLDGAEMQLHHVIVAVIASVSTASADPVVASLEPPETAVRARSAPTAPTADEPSIAERANLGPCFGWVPIVIVPSGGHGWGGGIDPELRYGFRVGANRRLIVAPGIRVAGYYVPKLHEAGLAPEAMVRFTLPLGHFAPYAALGFGPAAWVFTSDGSKRGVGTMGRVGVMYHVTPTIAVGLDAMMQTIDGTSFRLATLFPVAVLKL